MPKDFSKALREAIIQAIEEVGLENFKKGSSWFMSNRPKGVSLKEPWDD